MHRDLIPIIHAPRCLAIACSHPPAAAARPFTPPDPRETRVCWVHDRLRHQLSETILAGPRLEMTPQQGLPEGFDDLADAVSSTYDSLEARARTLQRELRLLRDQLPLAVLEWDGSDHIVHANPAARRLFGWGDQVVPTLATLEPCIAVDDRLRLQEALAAATGGTKVRGLNLRIEEPGGGHRHTRWTVTRLVDDSHRLIRTIAVVDELASAAADQLASNPAAARASLAVHAVRDGIWDHDIDTGKTWFSPRCTEMLGLVEDPGWASLDEWLDHVDTIDQTRARELFADQLNGEGDSFEIELRVRNERQERIWVQLRGSVVRDLGNRPVRIAGSMSDITERKRYETRLVYASLHDDLTGLPNRRFLLSALAERGRMRLHARRTGDDAVARDAIITIDLDHFRDINDRLGPTIGDRLLCAYAHRLARRVRAGDVVARLGGDEFAVLMLDVGCCESAVQVARRLQSELCRPFSVAGAELDAVGTMGVACTDTVPAGGDELLRASAIAMASAKDHDRGGVACFRPIMDEEVRGRLQLLGDLRQALERDELRMVFQPIVDVRGGRPLGFEALLRWRHNGVDIPPDHFIPAAVEAGLMEPIGAWVIDRSVASVARWLDAIGPHLYVSVNMSSRELELPDLFTRVDDALRRHRVDPQHVAIEVTETSMIHGKALSPRLAYLRSRGHRIMIDDFGTGYASLQNLLALEFDTIKIDREFCARCAEGQSVFLEAIAHLARRLGKDVVAEGIENPDLLRRLSFLGVRCAQGYGISRPLEADAVLPWLGLAPHPAEQALA